MTYTIDHLVTSLLGTVKAEMDKLVEEEAAAASERVLIRAKALAPRLAMEMFKNFDIHRNQHDIVIRVRQDPK